VTPHVFTQSSKLRLMQRLIACFQAGDVTIPDGWLVSELEAFEFTYTATGVKYEAPKGYHDDGVMALGLAVYGWDRVQVVKPEPARMGTVFVDDPTLDPTHHKPALVGDFTSQLPSEGW
jgi:hypothetical protein